MSGDVMDTMYPDASTVLEGNTLSAAMANVNMRGDAQDYLATQPPKAGCFAVMDGKVMNMYP